MQEYSLKRGYKPDIERINDVLEECFPGEIVRDGDKLKTSYGAISDLIVWIEGKKMAVDTVSDPSVTDNDVVLDTNKRFRDFLYAATGYTAKERVKKAKQAVSK